jgi:hypothetical protein
LEKRKYFLIEPGKGFTFKSRRYRINTEAKGATIVKYSVLKDNDRYLLRNTNRVYLRSRNMSTKIERNKLFLEQQFKTTDIQ